MYKHSLCVNEWIKKYYKKAMILSHFENKFLLFIILFQNSLESLGKSFLCWELIQGSVKFFCAELGLGPPLFRVN